MAQRTLQANFKRFLTTSMRDIGYMSGLGDNVVFDLHLGGVAFIDGIKKGMQPILKAHGLGSAANSNKVWTDVARRTAKIIKRTNKMHNVQLKPWNKNVNSPGIYLVKTENIRILIRFIRQKKGKTFITGDNRIAQIATSYRDIAYRMWLKVVEEHVKGAGIGGSGSFFFGPATKKGVTFTSQVKYQSQKRGSTQKTVQSIIAQNTNVAHKEGTTKADLGMKKLKESNPSLSTSLDISVFDIMDYAEKNLDVTFYKNDSKQRVGNYKFDTIVEARLAYNQKGSEDSDKKATVNKFEEAVASFIQKALGDKKNKWHKLLSGVDSLASKTPRKRIVDDVTETLIANIAKAKLAKRVGKKKAKFKNSTRKIPVKRSKKTSATRNVVQKVSISGKTSRPDPVEKVKEKDASTLLRIESLINKKLPARIRKNMGRPALISQTGRFSNSVELKSLRPTAKGLSGEYTYQLSPYETFENTGSRRWPVGYNPKPLIAKSIRELAIGVTEEKLVSLRRV